MDMKRAYRLETYAKRGPWGLTKLYAFVKDGRLSAQKIDGTTFVTEESWDRFLSEAPLATDARQQRVAKAA